MLSFWKNFNLGFLNSLGGHDGYVALDIGSSSIKMVEAAVDKSGYRILNLGILPLPVNAIQNNMVVDSKPVVETIRKLIETSGVRSKQVISAVPGRAVIMKKVQMPKQEPAELEANIEFEAQNVIPENLENVNLDHQVLSQSDDGNRMEVLLVAVKKEIVNSYAEAIEEAGLTPILMDVDYFALENMYEANYATETENGVVGLIHIGAQYTSITLLHNGISTFTGDLSMGGGSFTDSLAQYLQCGVEAAEAFKMTGLLEGKKGLDLTATLRPPSEELAEEIRRTRSTPSNAAPSVSGWSMSPSTSSTVGNVLSAHAFARLLTSARTSSDRRANSRITADPLNPVAPVTSIMGISFRRVTHGIT